MSRGNRRFIGRVVTRGGMQDLKANFREIISPVELSPSPGGSTDLYWDTSREEYGANGATLFLTKGQPATLNHLNGPTITLGKAISISNAEITYSANGLPTGLSVNATSGVLQGTANPVGYNQVGVTATAPTGTIEKTVYICERGQVAYNSVGTFSFVVPNYVTSIGAVVVGGGGGAGRAPVRRLGGGGGGLRWIRDFPVTPGETLTVVVGAGGSMAVTPPAGGVNSNTNGSAGGPSYISRGPTVIIVGNGGGGGRGTPITASTGGGGTPTGPKGSGGFVGGGNGGNGTAFTPVNGAGGAGGYDSNSSGYGPAGGVAGGGAGMGGDSDGGGGVGLNGRGTADAFRGSSATRNAGGSGGSGGTGPSAFSGGICGGGGFANPGGLASGVGGRGGARIIWGSDRNYPSYNTGDL